MTPGIVQDLTGRYIELYEHITGLHFEKAADERVIARIERNVTRFLNEHV